MDNPRPDRITQEIGVLKRRETEARIIAPIIDALADSFGKEEVLEVIKEKIISLSQQQGENLSEEYGNDVDAFLKTFILTSILDLNGLFVLLSKKQNK